MLRLELELQDIELNTFMYLALQVLHFPLLQYFRQILKWNRMKLKTNLWDIFKEFPAWNKKCLIGKQNLVFALHTLFLTTLNPFEIWWWKYSDFEISGKRWWREFSLCVLRYLINFSVTSFTLAIAAWCNIHFLSNMISGRRDTEPYFLYRNEYKNGILKRS